jgi:hypothetical protein
MKNLLIHVFTYCLIGSALNAHGMTPKYPYEPVTTPCLNEVTLVGEAIMGEDKFMVRLQADLTIIETANTPECPSIPNIKVVFLEFKTKEVLATFNDLLGSNVSVVGSVQPGNAIDTNQVTFTATGISIIE